MSCPRRAARRRESPRQTLSQATGPIEDEAGAAPGPAAHTAAINLLFDVRQRLVPDQQLTPAAQRAARRSVAASETSAPWIARAALTCRAAAVRRASDRDRRAVARAAARQT